MRFGPPLATAIAMLSCSLAARALPVTYTLSGTLSGTLGTTTFSQDPGTFTFTGDTAGITSLGGGYYVNTDGTSTLALNGFKTATFVSPTFGVESEYNAASFYDVPTGFAVGTYNESIGSYDLSAPFGPVTGFYASTGAMPELTSLGELTLTGGGDTTFQASAITPEPSSLLLLGTGVLGAAGVLRRRGLAPDRRSER